MVIGVVTAVLEHQAAGGIGEVQRAGQIAVDAGFHSAVLGGNHGDLHPHFVGIAARLGGIGPAGQGGGGVVFGQFDGEIAVGADNRHLHPL